MSEWDKEVRKFEDKRLARLAWEMGRESYCAAGILADEERTEREWAKAWDILSVDGLGKKQPMPWKERAMTLGNALEKVVRLYEADMMSDPEVFERPGWIRDALIEWDNISGESGGDEAI